MFVKKYFDRMRRKEHKVIASLMIPHCFHILGYQKDQIM